MVLKFYDGLLSGSFCLEGARHCRYWQYVVLEIDLSGGVTNGILSRTELRKEIEGETEEQEHFKHEWNVHLEEAGASLETFSVTSSSDDMLVLDSVVVSRPRHSSCLTQWDKCRYRLHLSGNGDVLAGTGELMDERQELIRLSERLISDSMECRWEGLAVECGRTSDDHAYRNFLFVTLQWDPCVGNIECSLSRTECLKEVDGGTLPRSELPTYLIDWLTTFGACKENLSGHSELGGSVKLHCNDIVVTKDSASTWDKFIYELRMSERMDVLTGTVVPDESEDDDGIDVKPGTIRLLSNPVKVISLEPLQEAFAVLCRNMSGDALGTIEIESLQESVAQFRARVICAIPRLPHGRIVFVLPCGSVLDDFQLKPFWELVGLDASHTPLPATD